ncbi:MAG: adenylyl-sulfate kinase [Nanoarchaeota archaeon]
MSKRAVFVGRWCPFHKGHLAIMQKKIDEGKPLLVLVRDTHYDAYPSELRKRMIEAAMSRLNVDCRVMIVDDIESINYGRSVGYEVNEIDVDESTANISATEIRKRIDMNDNSWQDMMPDGADKVLKDYIQNKGIVVWLTGLPSSGKSTIANIVSDYLKAAGVKLENLDSHVIREKIAYDLSFTHEDRQKSLERATFIAKLLSRNGVVVFSSFITPLESMRKEIREDVEKEASFVEIYVKASIESCKKRDKKGMYEKAERGEIKNFTGVSSKFEEPANPDLVVDTDKYNEDQCARMIIDYLNGLVG